MLQADRMDLPLLICVAMTAALMCLSLCSRAADPRPTLPPAPKPAAVGPEAMNYGDISVHLDHQHDYTCHLADEVLRAHRPSLHDSAERKAALLALDEATHYKDPDAGKSPALLTFLKNRTQLAAYEIGKTRVTDGAVIWKLYDHAFVVRTASVTFAIDLTRGSGFWWDDPDLQSSAKRIIGQCDALFISHEHGDHLDPYVVEAFKAQGKPVLMPGSLKRDGTTRHTVKLANGKTLKVVVFPGYQGDLINDVRIIYTPEGISFAHTGDLFQSNSTPTKQFDWIDQVKDNWDVDVLMVNIWAPHPQPIAKGFDPELVIPGHENELGHGIDDRKPYWMSYERLQGMDYPYVVMAWGESYYYVQADKP